MTRRARFLVVGAHALAVNGVPRATGDLDVWIDTGPNNVPRVWDALLDFGAPVEGFGIDRHDLEQPNQVIQIRLPPRRIDLLATISGVQFEAAWNGRTVHSLGGLDVPFLGYDEFIANKRAAGRAKDLADLEELSDNDDRSTSRHRCFKELTPRPSPERQSAGGRERSGRRLAMAAGNPGRRGRQTSTGTDSGGILVDMKYKVVLQRSEEGVSATVPGLPGCWSQGATEEEALDNIKVAVQEYLEVVSDLTEGAEVREIEIAV